MLIALPAICHAQTLIVSNLNNSGPGSLREAITEANLGLGDEIKFTVTGTITLQATLPEVTTFLSIAGPPAPGITISGNNTVRLMEVGDGSILILDNLTLTNGFNLGSDFGTGQAGGILNNGLLQIHHCTLSSNIAKGGSGGGSAIGGAILNNGTVILDGSTLTANQAQGAAGTGPIPQPGSGRGGAIYNRGTLFITNSTFQGNIGRGGFVSGAANGGALLNNGGTTVITNATFSGNQANGFPTTGGGAIENFGGDVSFKGLILTASNFQNCAGTLTDEGYNLADDETCSFTKPTSLATTALGIALDPKGLQPNGGVTDTIALEPGSEAINQIPIGDCTDLVTGEPLSVDQRGFGRPGQKGGNCSIGAYEFQAEPAIDCSEAEASNPTLITLGVFQPEQVTGVINPNGAFGINVTGVTQSKPVPFGLCPDAKVNGETTFLRSINPGGGGLEYQIGFTATDSKNGDSCEGSVSVCVQPFGQRTKPCENTGQSYDAINCRRP
jgi:hypothetical protein